MSIVQCDDYDEILEVERKIENLNVDGLTFTDGEKGQQGEDGGNAVSATVDTTKPEAGLYNGQLVYVNNELYMWYDKWYKQIK